MFVSYCLEKAGIGESIMPHSANCNRWKGYLGSRYIDDEDSYYPEAGDLIFFHHDRVSKDPNFPNHIGIVTGYDAEKNVVYTVEGNSGKSVRTHEYAHESSVIVGYASMRYCMVRWDKEYKSRMQQSLTNALIAALEGLSGGEDEEAAQVEEIAGGEAVGETGELEGDEIIGEVEEVEEFEVTCEVDFGEAEDAEAAEEIEEVHCTLAQLDE